MHTYSGMHACIHTHTHICVHTHSLSLPFSLCPPPPPLLSLSLSHTHTHAHTYLLCLRQVGTYTTGLRSACLACAIKLEYRRHTPCDSIVISSPCSVCNTHRYTHTLTMVTTLKACWVNHSLDKTAIQTYEEHKLFIYNRKCHPMLGFFFLSWIRNTNSLHKNHMNLEMSLE